MKLKVYLFFITIILLFGSCSPSKPTLKESFDYRHIIGEELPIANGFFANPGSIEIIDTIMLFVDRHNNKYFTSIDIKNKKAVNRFGLEGKGPNELSFPDNLVYNKKEKVIYFSLHNPKRYWYLKSADLTNSDVVFEEKINLNIERSTAYFFNLVPIQNSNEEYFATGMFHDGMYGICRSDGKLDTIIGQYTIPDKHKAFGTYLLGTGYQGLIKSHPEKSLIAYASSQHNLIEVIDCSTKEYKIKRFHGGDFPELSEIDNSLALSRYHPLSFIDLCTTKNYIYAIHSGKNFAEHGQLIGYCNLLYVFDWDLKPIICYELDHNIRAIKVNENDKTLYSFALNEDDKMVLMQWKLTH